MIQREIRTLVYKINSFINENSQVFNRDFNIKILLNIENKKKFKHGFCGAITAKGQQCSRKPNKNYMFCGLHRCDMHAHKRKRTKTVNYLDISDNITSNTYTIIFNKVRNHIDINNTIPLLYKNQHYLLNIRTNILYQKNDNVIIELGNFYRFNVDFVYV